MQGGGVGSWRGPELADSIRATAKSGIGKLR